MELKIKIPERIYDEITKEGQISLSDLHELFDAIRNGIPADEAIDVKEDKDAVPVCEFVEIRRLITVFLGRELDPHEADILCLYDTIRQNKKMLAELDGPEKLFVKMLIRSLVS